MTKEKILDYLNSHKNEDGSINAEAAADELVLRVKWALEKELKQAKRELIETTLEDVWRKIHQKNLPERICFKVGNKVVFGDFMIDPCALSGMLNKEYGLCLEAVKW